MQIQSEANVKRFNQALNELRKESPTDGIDSARALFNAHKQGSKRTVWLIAGVAATAIATIVLLALPTKSEAHRLQEVREAIEAKGIRHTMTYHAGPPFEGTLSSEIWSAGKLSRMDSSPGEPSHMWSICDGATRWTFVPSQKDVFISKQKTLDFSADTLPELVRAIKQRSPDHQVTLKEKTLNGRVMLELTEDSYFLTFGKNEKPHRYPLKTVYIANLQDKLPRETLHYQAKHSADGRQIQLRLVAKGKIEYPSEMPKGLFDHDIPKGWKVIHM